MEGFNEYLKLFGSYLVWENVFDIIRQRVRVGEIKSITFEIRTKEQGHNVPHIHAAYEDNNISISLIDFTFVKTKRCHRLGKS